MDFSGTCGMRAECTPCSQRPKPQPSSSAQPMASAIAHHTLATSDTTCGVKYSPSAMPMVHWPALRSGVWLAVGSPAMEASDTAISGPIIQGSGVCSTRHAPAAASASSSVASTRTRKRKGTDGQEKAEMDGTAPMRRAHSMARWLFHDSRPRGLPASSFP